MTKQKWHVELYVDARDECPVKTFIGGLQPGERAAVWRDLDLLSEFGTALKEPYVRHIDGTLWEIRSGSARIFYFAYTGRRFILLSGYYKKSNKAPKREIDIAKRRLADFLDQH